MHRIMQPSTIHASALVTACAAVAWLALGGAAAQADPYTMKISVPTIHDIPNEWISGFSTAVEKDSGATARLLWSELGESLAQRLAARLGVAN